MPKYEMTVTVEKVVGSKLSHITESGLEVAAPAPATPEGLYHVAETGRFITEAELATLRPFPG